MARIRQDLQQYFVALIPPLPVYDEAMQLRQYFSEKYNSKASLRSPPHITLHMPFRMPERKEAEMVAKFGRFVKRFQPIKICLDNFSSFPPRVIFVRVTESETLFHFQKSLERFCKTELNLFNAGYRDVPFHPHLTLAFRDLKKTAYREAWDEFKSREYKAEFVADKLSLLKHDGKRWQVFRELPLESSFATDVTRDLEATEG